MNTCGYRSRSIWRCARVGDDSGNSYPAHISNNKCPKQITSMLSISVDERDHNTELTRELNPNKLFSKPDNLK